MVQLYSPGCANVHPQLIVQVLWIHTSLSCKQHLVRSREVERVNVHQIIVPNFVKVDRTVVEIWQFLGDRLYTSSAVAEMGDHGHNRHGPKRRGCCAPFAERWKAV